MQEPGAGTRMELAAAVSGDGSSGSVIAGLIDQAGRFPAAWALTLLLPRQPGKRLWRIFPDTATGPLKGGERHDNSLFYFFFFFLGVILDAGLAFLLVLADAGFAAVSPPAINSASSMARCIDCTVD